MAKFGHLAWALGVVLLAGATTQSNADQEGFVLRDFLGRTWHNERVSYPLTAAQAAHAKAGHALVGPEGKAVLYQVLPGDKPGESRLEFLADLGPYETREYVFSNQTAKLPTDLVVEETPELLQMSNSLVGIAVPRQLAEGAGPIGRLRLPGGKVVGGSQLKSDVAPTAYTATVTARGPVFAEVTCRTTFGEQGTWEIRFQVQAGEPVIRVLENSAVSAQAQFLVFPELGMNADKLLYRTGKGQINLNRVGDIAPGEVCVLEPWCHWWERERQGPCFTLFNSAGAEAISCAAGFAGQWVDPSLPKDKPQAPPQIFVKKDDQGLYMTFPLKFGRRMWMITGLRKEEALAGFKQDEAKTLLPYEYLIKHGQFPLDLVKDYTLVWKGEHENHPRALVTQKDVERFRQSIADRESYTNAIPRLVKTDPQTVTQFSMEPLITTYFATGDEELGKHLAVCAAHMLERTLYRVVMQPDMPFGSAPHHLQDIGASALLADAALAVPQLDPVLRERMLGQLAFLGYTVTRPDYWSGARGFAANPNMTTSVLGYQTTIACTISDHPLAREWAQEGMEQLKGQVEHWADDNGGWLEAPHYAMVSCDQILASFVMARNAGFNDYLYLPKLRKFLDWFSKISTPPDSRIKGWRHLPPVGNTYLQEPTGEFGIVAYLFRDRDPEWAAEMQWMYRRQGEWPWPGIGGGYPGFAGYRAMMLDPTLPEKAPPWKSELFPETGVVLRNAYDSDRETYLHMIQGSNHAHYDDDSGSVIIWGKGRIIADDFGYYIPERSQHSMVESPQAGGVMRVTEFAPGERLDYVKGVQGGWTRQIAFAKDADPLGPNYFVIADTLQAPAPAKWRLYLHAQNVATVPQGAFAQGHEDVDTNIFFAAPANVPLTTVPATHAANAGLNPEGRQVRLEMTQIALTATTEREQLFTVVVYPRLKTEEAPGFEAIAEGRGVKVESPAGTDYVFLGREPFEYKGNGVEFIGTVGAVQVRGGKAELSLGAPGKISALGKTLEKGTVTVATRANLLPVSDFEDGKLTGWMTDPEKYNAVAQVFEGNPVPNDTGHTGKYCLEIKLRGTNGMTWAQQPLYVDPTRLYRIGFRYYTPHQMRLQYGGYGTDPQGQAKDPKGRVWEWRDYVEGPTEGWQLTETTIGPPGSGAKTIWLPSIFSTGFGLRISGEENLTVYLDDLRFEEIRE